MKKLLLVLSVLLSCTIYANDLSAFGLTMSKDDIIHSLQVLHKQGKISDTDYAKAVKELKQMDQAKVDKLIKKGTEMAKKKLPKQ